MNRAARGFTLIELVVTMVIAVILAAFAMARISTQSFDTEGFHNRALAMVRYAQKVAIAQRRTVSVVIATNSIRLCYSPCGGGDDLHEPPGTNAFTYATPSDVQINGGTLGTFSFDSLGRPSASGYIRIQGDVNRDITVEAETGYAR